MTYVFEISSLKMTSNKVDNSYSLNLDIHEHSTSIDLKFELGVSRELELTNFNILNKTTSYLQGFFEMSDDLMEYYQARDALVKKVNQGAEPNIVLHSPKWDIFSSYFRQWFKNSLKPNLAQLKLVVDSIHKLY